MKALTLPLTYRQLGYILVGTILFVAKSTDAQGVGSDNLLQKQKEQQRARVLTRELLTGILDVQFRQLEENGLTDHEIYREVHLMRQSLNRLVEIEMQKVIDQLASASQLPPDKREANLVEARQQIRTIVRQLSIERQGLLKRLKVVELAEQVRRLIQHQTSVQETTKNILVEKELRREALILKAIEDQRDVKELYLHLVDTLNDLASWNGLVATIALDGLRILEVADVNQHLDLSVQILKAIKVESAGDEQKQVIKGLNELLKLIERTQGSVDSDKLSAIEKVRALQDRQEQLREETKQLLENQPPSDEFVERQSRLKQEIAELRSIVPNNLKGQTYLEQAETAAFDAAANLLENKPDPAIADQERVLGNLAAIELELNNQTQLPFNQESADDPSTTTDSTEDFADGQSISSENVRASKLTKKEGAAATNQNVKGGAIEKQREGTEASGMASSKSREKEEGLSNRRLKEEAWFAKLPPELRKSIRAGTAQKPPRAYEDRLNKYFQSID